MGSERMGPCLAVIGPTTAAQRSRRMSHAGSIVMTNPVTTTSGIPFIFSVQSRINYPVFTVLSPLQFGVRNLIPGRDLLGGLMNDKERNLRWMEMEWERHQSLASEEK